MTTTEKCVEIYQQKQMIHHVAQETGLPWHVVYQHLKKAGVLSVETRMVSGSHTDRMGAFYEAEFLKLVPSAQCQNDKQRQYEFDFLVGEAKVEIKSSSSYIAPSGRKHWKFRVFTRGSKTRTADFYVCFGRNDNDDDKNYSVFCFPSEFLHGANVNVSLDGGNEWAQFKIEPDDLQAFFDTITEVE